MRAPQTTAQQRAARTIVPYVIALVSVGVAFGLRYLVDPALGDRQPFVMFYIAVAVAVWFGGFWAGLLAAVGGFFVADWFFLSPRRAFSLLSPDAAELVGSVLYLLGCVVTAGLIHLMRRTEQQLGRSEARLKGLIGSATDAIIAIDAEQKVMVFNASAETAFGYSAAEMMGRPLDALIPAPYRQIHRRHVDEFGLTDGGSRQMGGQRVLVGLRRDGTEFPIEAQISQVQIDKEKLYTVIIRDITERKRAEEALAASFGALQRAHDINTRFAQERDLLAMLGETLDAAVEMTGADFGNIQLVNPATGLLEIVAQRGFEREFLDLFAVVRDDEAACGTAKTTRSRVVVVDVHTAPMFHEPALRRVMQSAGVRAVQSTPLINRNGERVGMLSTHWRAPHRPRDGDLRFVDLLAQQSADIIAHARAEQAREELLTIAERARAEAEDAAEKLRRVQRIADAMLAERSLDELLREVLLRIRETLEADTAIILVRKLEDEDEEEELRVRAAVGLEEAVDEHVSIRIGEYFAGRVAQERKPLIWNNADPELIWPLLRRRGVRALAGVPLQSGDRLLGVLHVGSIEPREFTGEEVDLLRLAGERIALGIERAASRDVERRARERAEGSSRMKDEFLAMLGHELRNPLSAVRNAIATASLDEARRPRAMEIARRQADQLGRLIDDLLDVARITQGRITLRKERVHLAEIIERAVESTRSFIEGRGLALSVSASADSIRIEADPARLEQVFVNVLTNAAKYTEAGGRIDLKAEREGEEAVVRIRDTGIGIAAEMLPRIWDLFTQADRAPDRAQGGLGIGLTVARRLVQLHGGRIEAHSDGLGKGAEFIVRLSALPPSTTEEARPAALAEVIPQKTARVLLVEDSPEAAESMTMLLELLGHRVRAVHDGVAALDAARANIPDVMIVDIGLPGMDGYEVARRVRRDPDLKHVVLLALTGYGREEDKQQALAAGFDYHLVKPVSPDALHGLVSRLGKPATGKEPTVH